MALPCVPVPVRAMLPGLLAAARSEDAVLGLMCPHPLADRGAAERFVQRVRQAAEADGHARPVFLQAGPVRVSKVEPEALGAPGGPLPPGGRGLLAGVAGRVAAAGGGGGGGGRRAALPVVERELSLEVSLPARPGARSWRSARALLEGLAGQGMACASCACRRGSWARRSRTWSSCAAWWSWPGSTGRGWRWGRRGALGAGAADVRGGGGDEGGLRGALRAAGAGLVPGGGAREPGAEGREGGADGGGAAGRAGRAAGAPGAPEAARLEALTFAEASEVLASLGAARTGWKSMQFLAENRGD